MKKYRFANRKLGNLRMRFRTRPDGDGVTDDAYGATIAKRRLSHRSAELREASGYTANHVGQIPTGDAARWAASRPTSGSAPRWSRMRDLLRIYGVTDGAAEEVEELAIRARARPWWRDFPEIFDSEFPGYENDATTICAFMPLILPGLSQMPAYIESLLRTGPRPPKWRRDALAARLRRQEILDRSDGTAPMLSAVITEASLLYRWGTHGDRKEQILHLVDLAGRANVELRIQRFEDGDIGRSARIPWSTSLASAARTRASSLWKAIM